MPQPTKLDSLRQADEANFTFLANRFSNEIRIIEDLSVCYDKLAEGFSGDYIRSPAQDIAGLIVCGHCGSRLIVATACLMRRYASSMYRETRSAIEGAGISHAIQESREMLDIYMEDEKYKGQRKKAPRHVFKPETIFPNNIPALKQLGDEYNLASARGHMNITTVAFHLARSQKPAHTRMNAQDIQDNHLDHHFILHLLWLGFAHLDIFNVVDLIFPDHPLSAEIKRERDYIGGKLARFNQKHKIRRP